MHKKSSAQLNQLQLENVLAAEFAEFQIAACVIHYKVMDCAGALLKNPGADRFILFRPMFVPEFVLSEPNFKVK